MDTWEPVLHNPGSWLWQGSRKVPPVSQSKLWWLLSSVRDSQGGRLDDGHPPKAGQPQTVPGLESQKLLVSGTQSSNREPGCLTTLLQQTACGFSSSQGLLVREAGGGGLAVSVTPRLPGWAMSYVQFTTEKDSGWARVSTRSRASDARQGQSTSMKEWPYKGPLNWLPDRCCRMEGLVLAASPSFLQTTLHISRTMAFSFSLRSSSQLS